MHSKVQTVSANKTKYRKNRAHDYLYDPVYVVSGPKDHHKCAVEAVRASAEFKICPVFPSMFTDLHTCPRNVMAIKSFDKVPRSVDRSWAGRQRNLANQPVKQVHIDGADRHLFCQRPMVPYLHPVLPPVRFPQNAPSSDKMPKVVEKPRTFGTQTDYRESETQTTPWEPPYEQTGHGDLEILSLAHLSWENGLPAGMHEVEIIERARMKRAWESTLPPITDAQSMEKRRKVIELMEQDEWAFREKEIQHINNLRLKLSRELMKENQAQLSEKLTDRINRYWAARKKLRDKKVASIKHKANRELRKLRMKHDGVNKKYHKVNVVDEHDDRKSDWYGPQMRFGEHPKRTHEVINCRSRLLTHLKGLDVLEKMPRFLPPLDRIRTSAPRREWELCIRETRWTEEVLRKLHEDLKGVRMKRYEKPPQLRLVTRIQKPVPPPATPSIEGVPDWEEAVYQSSVFLQKIVKGRAVQTMMFRGRERCRELIEELKSTHALHEAGLQVRSNERFHIMSQQRSRLLEKRREDRLTELLCSLEGQTLATSLDFLSKELWRLQDERRAHAFALLAERMRHRREAAEAGRRQLEERRRREHDDMFKQIVKVHQDTVDVYLEDIILESMSWVAEKEARKYVRQLAKRVDEAAQEAHKRRDCLEREELVADLIHNFVLPEAEKQRVRANMKTRQEKYLYAAHKTIYNEIDNLHLSDPIPEESVLSKTESEPVEVVASPEAPSEISIATEIANMLQHIIDETVPDEPSDFTEDSTYPILDQATSISDISTTGGIDPMESLFSNFTHTTGDEDGTEGEMLHGDMAQVSTPTVVEDMDAVLEGAPKAAKVKGAHVAMNEDANVYVNEEPEAAKVSHVSMNEDPNVYVDENPNAAQVSHVPMHEEANENEDEQPEEDEVEMSHVFANEDANVAVDEQPEAVTQDEPVDK